MIRWKSAEDAFFNLMKKECKKVRRASTEEDMYFHFDVEADGIKYDVKDEKKLNRSDRDVCNVIWLELTNVRGNPGWLKGQADKIAFRADDRFLIVDREKLLDFIIKFVEDPYIYRDKAYKKWYQRLYRKDTMTYVYPEDIRHLVERELLL